jgi:peptidoglycan/LPS O-acetylase OafA/YrhL
VDRRGNESLTRPGSNPGHLPALDGYRGLAMLLTLLHHFVLPLPGLGPGLHQLAEAGRVGLDLFFVLSGFLITGILLDTRGQPNYFRNFYMRRSLRISPLYYTVLLFFFIILPRIQIGSPATASLARMWDHEAHHWPWYAAYASNILFVIRNGFAPAGLDVTWSLGIEEQYYLSWALLVFVIGSRRLAGVCLALIGVAFVTRVAMLALGSSWIQIHVMTLARIDTLSFGGLLAVLVRSPRYEPRRFHRLSLWSGAAAILLLGILAPWGSVRHDSTVTLSVGYTLVGVLCAAGLVALIHAPNTSLVSKIFGSRFLRFFGKYSYAMYLFHIPIRDEIRHRFFPDAWLQETHGFELLGRQLLFFSVTTLASVALALVSWHLFEKHWLKLKRRFPRFSRPGASSPPDPSGHTATVPTPSS